VALTKLKSNVEFIDSSHYSSGFHNSQGFSESEVDVLT